MKLVNKRVTMKTKGFGHPQSGSILMRSLQTGLELSLGQQCPKHLDQGVPGSLGPVQHVQASQCSWAVKSSKTETAGTPNTSDRDTLEKRSYGHTAPSSADKSGGGFPGKPERRRDTCCGGGWWHQDPVSSPLLPPLSRV